MEHASNARPRGRPKVPDAARKRNNVTIRMRDALKSTVEQSAAAQGRSISEEIEQRLEASFAEEARFGGADMLALTNLMSGSFLRGAQLGARGRGHADWSIAEQLSDRTCFVAGARALSDALIAAAPGLEFKAGLPPKEREKAREILDKFAELIGSGSKSIAVKRRDEG